MVLDTYAPPRPDTDDPTPAPPPQAPPAVRTREHLLLLLTPHGLEQHRWYDDDMASQQRARALFDQQRALGYRLYSSATPGAPADAVTSFDPQAHEIVGVLPMCGGSGV